MRRVAVWFSPDMRWVLNYKCLFHISTTPSSEHQFNVRRYRFSQSQCCRLQLRAVSREDEGDTKCLVRQRSRFPLQLLSASPSLRQPQLSIAVLMSIGRRAYLAKGLTTFPRHPHLVRRYARIVGRDAYKMHQPTQPPKEYCRVCPAHRGCPHDYVVAFSTKG